MFSLKGGLCVYVLGQGSLESVCGHVNKVNMHMTVWVKTGSAVAYSKD
jgi:hypothetical protein